MRVSVIGGSTVTDERYQQAREVGKLLGEHGHDVVCGGLTGVMEAACRGASEAGGHAIEHVDTPAEAVTYVESAVQ